MTDHGTHQQRRRFGQVLLVMLPLLVFCAGCPLPGPAGSEPNGDATDADKNENSSLATATALGLAPGNDTIEFTGTIDGRDDIDVYNLGQLAAGDQVVVDISRTSGNLDPTAGIFDSREHLIAFNDDRAADGTNLNPRFDLVIPGDTDTYYLAIIAYPGYFTAGDYAASVTVARGAGGDTAARQIVFLDWDGGSNVTVQNVGVYNLSAFSATDVGLPAAQTEALKDAVQTVVAERYTGYNLIVMNSDDHAVPSQPHSTVYFGGRSFEAFAISQQIDTFNDDPADNAIVFTETFNGAFRTDPTLEQMAQALGNTVAHEVGHLLGLVHTEDCNSLMDTSCYNDRLLAPQAFMEAVLDDSVFPFGVQDATEILAWILGLVGA